MTEVAPPKRYELRPDESGAWAIIVIDVSRGYFSATSDHGGYAYLWTHPGGEFREFLVTCGLDYVYSKLAHAQRIFDLDGTKTAIKKAILKQRRSRYLNPNQARAEWDEVYSIHSEQDYYIWFDSTSLEEAYELYSTMREPQCWGFCQKIFKRFQEVLREELKKEKEDAEMATHAADR